MIFQFCKGPLTDAFMLCEVIGMICDFSKSAELWDFIQLQSNLYIMTIC